MVILKPTKLSLLLLLCSCGTSQLAERSTSRPSSAEHTKQTIETHVPEGWRIYGAVLRFVPKNLYEQINGRAEFYLA